MMPKSGGMFYRQANRGVPFAGRGLGRSPTPLPQGTVLWERALPANGAALCSCCTAIPDPPL